MTPRGWVRPGPAQPVISSSPHCRTPTLRPVAGWPSAPQPEPCTEPFPPSDRHRVFGSFGSDIDAPDVESSFAEQITRLSAVTGPRGGPSSLVDPSPGEARYGGGDARTLISAVAGGGRTCRRVHPGRTPSLSAGPRRRKGPLSAGGRSRARRALIGPAAASVRRCAFLPRGAVPPVH